MKKEELSKYEIIYSDSIEFMGFTLYRIRALKDFSNVNSGDLGGYICDYENLSQYGDAWVSCNAWVYGDALVSGDARVSGNARVSGDARVYDDAWVYGDALVSGDARVSGDALVSGNAWVSCNAWVSGDARVYDDAWVSGNALVSGNARVSGNAWVYGNALVSGNAWVYGDARVYGDALVSGDAKVYGQISIITILDIGRERGCLTMHLDSKIGVRVTRGCFTGTIEEFLSAVEKTHGDNMYGKIYRTAIEMAKIQFEID